MLVYAFYESDTRVQQYAKALVKRGDVVDVIALRRKDMPPHEVVNGVNVYRIQQRTVNERGRLDYLSKIMLFFFRAAVTLTKRHQARAYDLIHVHSVPDFLVFAALVPKLAGTPIILDIHDVLPEFYASKFKAGQDSQLFRLLLLIERWSITFSDHVIVANHIWHERLISRSAGSEKCTAICNYPDAEFFSSRTKGRTDGKFIIMYPGTLNHHQGLDIAINAFARIAAQAPETELHIYGEGPAKDSLVRLAGQLGLNGKVKFKEWLPTAQIAKVMAEADVAVVPKRAKSSFGNEAASGKVLEFMALNVPLVVSRTKIETYYFDDSMVKFFESENERDLADSILLLKNDKQLSERLVSNAARYVKQNNWEVKKNEYLNLVDSLVMSHRCENGLRLKA